ncbi:RIP metalloprotease RseP [Tepidicella baoligensis]|uniref:RIP metalloprotease RseP n=1 Tax=Tepidicella baoligensis TaxID=2707016 RepID=UPI0015DAD74E|nr:RIP metalloprotease RseP [Tepidicella baoligensis]
MVTVLAFLAALGLLIAVHEYGHYRVAVACGVKVLRFSIGFGKPLWRWQSARGGTEFVIGALPLGGYVRMLDEREGPVAPEERHRAFNAQPLRSRVAIVAAGPLANLLLAVALYAAVSWIGVQEPRPVLSSPPPASLAERAGVRGGEWVVAMAQEAQSPQVVESFETLRWQLTRAALSQQDVRLWLADGPDQAGREVTLRLSELSVRDADATLLQRIGIVAPWSAPVVGEILPGGAAEAAGLRRADVVLRVDDQVVVDGQHLRTLIREAVTAQGEARTQRWEVERDGRRLVLDVSPRPERVGDAWVGRVGAYIGAPPEMVTVSAGVFEGLWKGVVRTWEVSVLSLRMMYRMLVGEASLKNLSGPLTIADYAGQSASMGLTSYILFLALISVSLGVLNLLPLPVLDGGHLMYYLWEAVTGRPVSDVWMDRLQRGGMVVLLGLMSLAMFNDVARLLG